MAARFRNRDAAIAALRAIPPAMKQEIQAQGDKEVADLANAVRQAAPIGSDLEHTPGALRDSVHGGRDAKHELKWRVTVDAKDAKGRGIAKHVEFGHLARDGSHVPPTPFAYPTKRAGARGIKNRLAAAGRRGAKIAAPEYVKG